MESDKAIFLSNLDAVLPESAISRERNRRYRWRATPYQAEGIDGTLISAGPETRAEPVTLPLGVSGWHAVFLGLWADGWEGDYLMRVKLTGDASYSLVSREKQTEYEIDEVFWKYADLTDQGIAFAPVTDGHDYKAGVAYVKVVPLSHDEVAAITADRARRDTKRLIALEDNHGIYYSHVLSGPEDIHEWIEPYRDTDVGRLFWCSGGGSDIVSYPTKIGQVYGVEFEDFARRGDRFIAEGLRRLMARGIDTNVVARDYTRSLGIEFHLSLRMAAMQMFPPYDEVFSSRFYMAHPEWRCRDGDGSEVSRLSFAYSEVREYFLSLLAELASYRPDGLNLIWNRGGPYVLYEEPLVAGYRERTGKDARQLDERDPDYLRYRGETLTAFMRRVRELCDRPHADGRRLTLSTHVLSDEATNAFYGLDLATWVREGLVDVILPYPWRNQPVDLAYYGRLVAGSRCELYPELMPRRMPPAEYQRRMLEVYAAGAHGAALWDTNSRWNALNQWSMVRRLGHRDELASFDDGAGTFYRQVKMHSIGGYRVDKYPPAWGY